MINVTVRTNDNRTRTPAEVKKLLRDIAFVLRATGRIKLEIESDRKQSVLAAAAQNNNSLASACAA